MLYMDGKFFGRVDQWHLRQRQQIKQLCKCREDMKQNNLWKGIVYLLIVVGSEEMIFLFFSIYLLATEN